MTNEELILEYKNGNKTALEGLYTGNLNLINKYSKMYSKYAELEDLIQECFFAVQKAADTFDSKKGVAFSTWLVFWIRSVIENYINTSASSIHIPMYMQGLFRKYMRLKDNYIAAYGVEPVNEYYLLKMEIDADQLETVKALANIVYMTSLDKPLEDDEQSITLADTIPAEEKEADTVVDSVYNEQLSKVLDGLMNQLPDEQEKVVRMLYVDEMPLTSIADQLKISYAVARQKRDSALKWLRLKKRALKCFDSNLFCDAVQGAGVSRWKATGESKTEFLALRRCNISSKVDSATADLIANERELARISRRIK